MRQKILNKTNIPKYLMDVNKHLPFKIEKIGKVKELSGGNVGYVFSAEAKVNKATKKIILKQVLSVIKREDENIKMPLERIITEAKVINKIKDLIKENIVPDIYYLDKENYTMIMSDVKEKRDCLMDELAKNNLHVDLGGKFAKFFGRFHARTFNMTEDLTTAEWEVMENYYIPVHLTWGARKHFPEKLIKKILEESNQVETSLIWIDPVHRNIFVSPDDFRLIDFEFCLHKDPAIDLGIFLSHWFIKQQSGDPKLENEANKFIEEFIKEYKEVWLEEVEGSAEHLAGIISRANKWLGIYLLSRVDGKHGSYVENKKTEASVRQLGKDLINNKIILK